MKTSLTGTLDKAAKVTEQNIDATAQTLKKNAKTPQAQAFKRKTVNYFQAKAEGLASRFDTDLNQIFLKDGSETVLQGVQQKLKTAGVNIDIKGLTKDKAKVLADVAGIPLKEAKKIVSKKGFVKTLSGDVKKSFTNAMDTEKQTVKKAISRHYEKKLIEPLIVDMTAELLAHNGKSNVARAIAKNMGGKKKFTDIQAAIENGTHNEMLEGATAKQLSNYLKEVTGLVTANRAVLAKGVEKDIGFNTLEMMFLPFDTKLSALGDYAERKGDKNMVNVVKSFWRDINQMQAFEGVSTKLIRDADNILRAFPDDKQRNMVKYIMERKPTRVKVDSGMPGIQTDLMIDGAKALELGLNHAEVKAANRIQNTFRVLHEAANKKYNGKLDIQKYSDIAHNMGKYDSEIYKEGQSFAYGNVGDFGHNYFPLIANDKHKEAIATALGTKDPLTQYLKSNRYSEESYAIWKSRGIDTKLQQDIMLSKTPREVIDVYGKKYINSNSDHAGKAYIELIKRGASVTDPAGITANMKNGKRDIRSDYRTLIDHIEKHWTDKYTPQKQPSDIVSQTLATYTDVSTGYIIGANPKLLLFNTAQFIINGQFRDFSSSVRSMIKSQSIFKQAGKEAADIGFLKSVTNPTYVNKAAKSLTNNLKDPLDKKVVSDYFRNENFDVLQTGLVDMGPKMSRLFEVMLPMFRLSDLSSRVQALLATKHFAETQYNKVGRDLIMKGDVGATARLKTALHIDRFDKFERDLIMEVVKNPDEFISTLARFGTRKEIYNYHKLFKPQVLDKAGKHWATARVARFMSWPMHYVNYARGIAKAYEAGDKAPAKALATQAVVWYGVMAGLSGADIPVVSDLAEYGTGRTPGVGTAVNAVSTAMNFSGMLGPSIGALLTPAFLTGEFIGDKVRGGRKQSDYTTQEVYKKAKSGPLYRQLKPLIDFVEED